MPVHTPEEKKQRRGSSHTPKEKGGAITTAGRRSLDRDQFALPPRPEEKRRKIAGRFPVDEPGRQKNALAVAHGARTGKPVSSEEHEQIHRAVGRKDPELITQHRQRAHRGSGPGQRRGRGA